MISILWAVGFITTRNKDDVNHWSGSAHELCPFVNLELTDMPVADATMLLLPPCKLPDATASVDVTGNLLMVVFIPGMKPG